MLNEIAKEAHDNAIRKGFWESDNVPEKLMLVVTEIAEACESLRTVRPLTVDQESFDRIESLTDSFDGTFKLVVKDSFGDEIADAIIRLLDLTEHLGIDIDTHVRLKMRYNAGRERKHGKGF